MGLRRSHRIGIVQKQWARVDYRGNMTLVGLAQKSGHQEVVAVGTYAQDNETRAEVAFIVREDFQGLGIASCLLARLEEIARENDDACFVASVLQENQAMLKTFRKRYPHAAFTPRGGNEVAVVMPFASPAGGSLRAERSFGRDATTGDARSARDQKAVQ